MPHHPTLFIGLGGSGGKTLAHLKRLLSRSVSRQDLAANYRFLLFDSDESAWVDLKREFDAEFKADPDFLDHDREWYSLGGFNPQRRWQDIRTSPRSPDSADILRWIDPQTAATFPDQIVTIGAEARRQLGRFCFAHHFRPIQTRLLAELQSLNGIRVQRNITRHVQIVLVTSSCGGTGSSVFFDFLFMLSVLYNGIARSAPFLNPVIFSPKPYIQLAKAKRLGDELIGRYNANACAFFLELQYEIDRYVKSQGSGLEDFAMPSWPDAQAYNVNWQPFDRSALIVDAQREGPPTFIPFENLYSTAAELLLFLFVSCVNANLDDRLSTETVNLSREDVSPSSGSYPRFRAAGFLALEYPGSLLAQYINDRFSTEVLGTLFLNSSGKSQGELRNKAKTLFNEVIMAPLRPGRSSLHDEHSFESYARRQYLEPAGNPLQRFSTIDDFCVPDPAKPDAQPKVNPSSITLERLTAAINEVQLEARTLKTSIRNDFKARFGLLSRLERDTYYGNTLDHLQAEMETTINGSGIIAWSGNSGQEETGLAWHLMEEVAERKQQVIDELEKSNDRQSRIRGNVEGLDRLKEDILTIVEQSGGLFKRWSGSSDAILRSKLEAFAAKRSELYEEAFRNVLFMLEIEVLSYVGSRDPQVRPLEYFTYQERGQTSILRSLKDQGTRIRNWIGTTNTHAQARLDATVAALREQSRSLLTVYEPPLSAVMKMDGTPGELSSKSLALLKATLINKQDKLAELMARGNGKAVSWRSVCPTPDALSLDLTDAFLSGTRTFVRESIQSNLDLGRIVGRSIESQLAELSTDQMNEFKQILAVDKVAVFSPVSPGALTNRPKFRLMVTASNGEEGSVARRLGYYKGEGQAHLTDPSAAHRVLAVKVYSGLYLEDDFPWVSDVRFFYDKQLTYEPHLWADGRVRVSGGGSSTRWWRAFAVALAWGFLLQGEKWKTDANVAGLFTDRLKDEPDGYLHEPPFAIRRKEPHFLAIKLVKSMIRQDGRLECRLEGAGFEKVAPAGAYGDAWTAFLKRSRMLESIEFFHEWCGGVTHQYGPNHEDVTTSVVKDRADRARTFMNWLPQVLTAVRSRRDELKQMANRSDENESTMKVLGRVATELDHERVEIESALQHENQL